MQHQPSWLARLGYLAHLPTLRAPSSGALAIREPAFSDSIGALAPHRRPGHYQRSITGASPDRAGHRG